MRLDFKYIVIFVLLCFGIYYWLDHQPIAHPPGIVVEDSPQQEPLGGVKPFKFKEFTITPVARFKMTAMVLSFHAYTSGLESQLVPVDLALGWGQMSNPEVLKKIQISQNSRWYHYTYRFPPPIPQSEIITHSGNMHLIPSTEEIENKIKHVKVREVVHFQGYLVNVEGKNGWNWNSSVTWEDKNNRACELVWVEEFRR